MRSRIRSVAVAALAFVFYSCSENSVTGPDFDTIHSKASVVAAPSVVISQVYGGGGSNTAGTSYTRDFIELHNTTGAAVPINGWSVGYAAAGGNSWQLLNLPNVSIPAGGYFLIQTGTAGTAGATLSADVSGATGPSMSGSAGKVVLLSSTVSPGANTCPPTYVDLVPYGSGVTSCTGFTSTASLSTTTAAIRGGQGCNYTDIGKVGTDFTVAAPAPRNLASAAFICAGGGGGGGPVVDHVSVSLDKTTITDGESAKGTASAFEAPPANTPIPGATFTWTTSDATIATVDATGNVTTKKAGDVLIIATSTNGKTGSASLHINAALPPPPPADIVISQILGGGGNSGSTILNDYIELYNHSSAEVDLAGWSVQYASAAGPIAPAAWSVTPLSGKIQPGKYFLIQEAAGGSATATPLSNPDLVGSIQMGGTGGKVILARTTTPFTGTCPTGATITDRVGYGTSTATGNCVPEWGARMTSDVSSTLAAWRNNDGCDNTQIAANDFSVLTAEPRNSASPAKTCGQPVRSQSSATVVINELLSDPVNSQASSGQWFEVFNYGSGPVDLQGWTIVSGGSSQPNHVIASSVIVPAGGYAVLGRSANQAFNGGAPVNYNYFVGLTKTIWLDSKDFLMLVDNVNALVDSVAWTSMPHGVSVGVRNASSDNSDANGPNWGYATNTFGQGDFGTPGENNEPLGNAPPAVSTNHITVSGRVATDAPLPVGFEAQIFPSLLNQSNQVQTGHSFTWSSLTPSIATIDPATGVIHSVSPGTAVFRVVADDGTVKNHSLLMETGTLGNAQYGNNTEFGDPVDNDPSNDEIVRRPQFTSSYNQFKGQPNWVAYDLNGSQFVSGTDRCNCFTHDPLLPASFSHLTTADYTGAGSFAANGRTDANYGIDRGHMTRSSDRTTGTIDNADTYYLTNVVPQFADLNQGVWSNFEQYLHDLAGTGTKEVYIVTGPAGINTFTTPGSNGTIKNEGKIQIPASTWKIAVIMSRGQGLANVHSASDMQLIAVNMPNRPGVRNDDWHIYETTVNAIEQLTGYNFLSLLPDNIEAVVEGRTRAPISQPGGPYTAVEGSNVAFNGSASSDPDGDALTYAWQFGDGATGTGVTTTHAYADNGSYSAILTATDPAGASDATNTPVTITNAPPVVAAGAPFIANAGQSVTVNASFSDAGLNDSPWAYTFEWGDGSTSTGSTGIQGGISANHTYATAGSYSVAIKVTDKDGGNGSNVSSGTVRAAPRAATDGPYAGVEGSAIAMSGAGSSDVDGTIVSYAWTFGDGSTGAGASVSHTYANDGDYTVTLVVTDNDGLTSSVNSSAHVTNVAPVVGAFDGGRLPAGGTYSASGSFADPGADAWTATVNFGDGTGTQPLSLSGKSFTLSHVYSASGNYTVTVTVSDGAGSSSSSAGVTVLAAPTAAINGPFSSVEGSSVSMSGAASTDVDGTISSYAWNFGDGTTGTGASISHTYAQDGNYTVTLVVTDNDGLTGTTTATAQATNVAPAIAALGNVVQASGSYSATGSFADPGADSWTATVNYGDGSGSAPLSLTGKTFALAHTFAAGQTYTVTVTVSDDDATSTSTHTVRITAPPVANAGGPYSSSEGSSVAMSGSASSDIDGTVASYAWTFGDGGTGTGVNVSHTYAQDGNYTVTLTVTDNEGFTGARTTTVNVANVGAAIGTFAGATLLPAETYAASGSFADPGADTWSATVNYGDGSGTSALALSGKNFSLSHKYTAAGTFTVTVTVNDGGSISTATQTVTVLTPLAGANSALALLDQLVAQGKITDASAKSIRNRLEAAQKQIEKDNANSSSAKALLTGALNELDKAISKGDVSAANAAELRAMIVRLIATP
ncbi:MAG: PKD domain-containing protein [Gemmatimonadaceae bacterium]|nr:PKD domain-containing protein [Gemmatimonadaceae bacterium]